MAIEVARHRLETMLGMMVDWGRIESFLQKEHLASATRRSVLASTLSAALELAKEGRIEIRQSGAFGPLFVRSKTPAPAAANSTQTEE